MKRIILILATVLFGFSCEERKFDISELGLTPENFPYGVAINGFVSNEYTRCQVTVSKPVAITDSIGFIPIENAIVSLTDGTNTYPFEYMEVDEGLGNRYGGKYISVDSIKAEAGNVYTLNVLYNSRNYTASDTLPETNDESFDMPFLRDRSYGKEVKTENWVQLSYLYHNFGYSTPCAYFHRYSYDEEWDSEPEDIYRLHLPAYCHVGSVPQGLFPNWTLGSGISGNDNDSVELVKTVFSEVYYNYFLTVQNETRWSASTFSTAPGNVKTNISEGGIGFFYAINTTRKSYKLLDLWNKYPYKPYE